MRESYLEGARGPIRPSTVDAAKACDAAAVRDQNYFWLKSKWLRMSEGYTI
jgi:hypothetical protein